MSSQIEMEAANIIFPLKNTTQMKAQAEKIVGVTPQTIDLEEEFGPDWRKGFYTIVADGAKMYLSLGHTIGTISEILPTGASGLSDALSCWPIPDGEERNYRVPQGREVGSGVAEYVDYQHLHVKVPSGGTTGMFRIARSSQDEDTFEFRRDDY